METIKLQTLLTTPVMTTFTPTVATIMYLLMLLLFRHVCLSLTIK